MSSVYWSHPGANTVSELNAIDAGVVGEFLRDQYANHGMADAWDRMHPSVHTSLIEFVKAIFRRSPKARFYCDADGAVHYCLRDDLLQFARARSEVKS